MTMNIDIPKYSLPDLGCGVNKHPGALRVDIIATDDVDIVMDLDSYPWDLPHNSSSKIYSELDQRRSRDCSFALSAL